MRKAETRPRREDIDDQRYLVLQRVEREEQTAGVEGMKTAYQIWRDGPRHEDYEEWLQDVVPRIMEENTKLHEVCSYAQKTLSDCWTDIGHWIQLAKAQREDLDDPDHEPNTPSTSGIRESERIQDMIGETLRRLKNV